MTDYVILGHSNPDVDSIVSGVLLEKVLKYKNISSKYIIPDKNIDKDTFNLCMKYGLNPYDYQGEIPTDSKVILVDNHDEDDLNVVAIIDHHPTNKESKCSYYVNKSASSTTCLIAQGREDLFSKELIQLAVAAAFIDSASFNSTKARECDKEWAKEMCNKYSFDYDMMYQDGLALTDISDLEKAAFNGIKKYSFNENRVEASYISVSNRRKLDEPINNMVATIEDYVDCDNTSRFLFTVYDMSDMTSTIYDVNKDATVVQSFDGLLSRGKTIIPLVEEEYIPKTYTKKTSTN